MVGWGSRWVNSGILKKIQNNTKKSRINLEMVNTKFLPEKKFIQLNVWAFRIFSLKTQTAVKKSQECQEISIIPGKIISKLYQKVSSDLLVRSHWSHPIIAVDAKIFCCSHEDFQYFVKLSDWIGSRWLLVLYFSV